MHSGYRTISVAILSIIAVVIVGIIVIRGFDKLVLNEHDFVASVLPAVLVDLANADRAATETPTLRTSAKLERAAQLKANDMASKGYFAHNSPEGVTPWHWFNEVGYKFVYAGENLAINFNESSEVNTAWLNSPTHKANIMNDRFTEIGIATAEGIYQGKNSIFVVQMFGKPRSNGSLSAAVENSYLDIKSLIPDINTLAAFVYVSLYKSQ